MAASQPQPKESLIFSKLDMAIQAIKETEMTVDGIHVSIAPFALDYRIWVARCTYSLGSELNEQTFDKKLSMNAKIRNQLLSELAYEGDLVEEYAVTFVSGVPAPERFIQKHTVLLAGLLRKTDKPATIDQAKMILTSQVYFNTQRMAVVDWEGALVFTEQPGAQDELDLLMVGNYQLLRYRMMDEQIETNLHSLHRILKEKGFHWPPIGKKTLITSLKDRLDLLLDFEHTKKSLFLIGDWYPAQLYRTIVEEFYIDDWEKIVSNKLESMSDIDEVIRNNITISWSRIVDFIQIAGWGVILIGYFILFILDISTRVK